MDRRDFFKHTAALSTVISSGGIAIAQTPNPPDLFGAIDTSNEIALSAKRYDGSSGTATFSGVVPFQPGQMTTSRVSNISIWNGTTELPIYASSLSPRHPDGSVKCVLVQTSLTLDSAATISLQLRLTVAPTAGTVSPITIDTAWMQEPTLLACADAMHMCRSRVAPAPLIPTDHPNLPAKWKTFLTTQFDSLDNDWPTFGNAVNAHRNGRRWADGGNANYNNVSAAYYRYMTSGDIDKLADANFMMTQSVQYNIRDLTHGNGAMTETGSGNPYNTDVEGYGVDSLALYGLSEWNSGFRADMYICHCMSGWEQAKRTLIANGARGYNSHQGDAFPYGARFDWRLNRTGALFYGLLSEPLDLTYSIPQVFSVDVPNIMDNRQAWLDRIVVNHFDKPKAWSEKFDPDDYRHGVWGCAPEFGNGNGTYENFQAVTVFNDLIYAYLNFVQDSRVPDGLLKLCDLIYDQTQPFFPNAFGRAGQLYCCPYMMQDPASLPVTLVEGDGDNPSPWSVGTTNVMMAWAYAYTGDNKYLPILDAHADVASWVYQSNLGSAGNGYKQIGEVYHMAYHAAAWRAGVNFDSWT